MNSDINLTELHLNLTYILMYLILQVVRHYLNLNII